MSDLETVQSTSASDDVVVAAATSDQVTLSEIKQIREDLSFELHNLKESVKLKDSEIERLNQKISNLQTLVQIESLKTELANLRLLSSKDD